MESLPNSRVLVRGHESEPQDAFVWDAATRPLLLFPHEDAVPIEQLAHADDEDRPVTLIVPDGNWRQASKVRARVAGMHEIPCVSLPAGVPSIYRLRNEAHAFGLATLEAIARALRVLEGPRGPHVEEALLRVFRAMVERTLWSRGVLEAHEIADGIPEGVQSHNPRAWSV